jgi:hypothetical protein
MEHLIKAARKNGFRHMYSVDASSNAPMRDLAKAPTWSTLSFWKAPRVVVSSHLS